MKTKLSAWQSMDVSCYQMMWRKTIPHQSSSGVAYAGIITTSEFLKYTAVAKKTESQRAFWLGKMQLR